MKNTGKVIHLSNGTKIIIDEKSDRRNTKLVYKTMREYKKKRNHRKEAK